ncbi:perlucin-like [Rhynchophorus ferrugineus]|uniref:perlucin-like n=1 Tax=Rhynchophorus ferrugineus TaxID=354439 RepID=UPI003FCD9C12
MKLYLILFGTFLVFISTVSANKYVISNQKVTFHEGYLRCRQYGLDPAEILSESDQKELEEVLQLHKEVGVANGYWMFATNLVDKTTYYWLNSNLPLFYSAFSAGQPDNAGNRENCLEIFQHSIGVFMWNDYPCDTKLRFICQHKLKKNAKSCDENMVGFDLP